MTDPRPVTENSASESGVREAKQRAGLRERKRADVWNAVFATAAGKQVFLDLIDFCGAFAEVDVEHTNRAMKLLGRQSVGQFVLKQLEAAHPGAMGELTKLHNERGS